MALDLFVLRATGPYLEQGTDALHIRNLVGLASRASSASRARTISPPWAADLAS